MREEGGVGGYEGCRGSRDFKIQGAKIIQEITLVGHIDDLH